MTNPIPPQANNPGQAPDPLSAVSAPASRPKLRIVLADDQAMIRQGLAYILNSQPDMQVVGEAADGLEAVEIVRRRLPDVILMDIRMPNRGGIEATADILRERPNVKVLLLTTFDVEDYVYDGIRAGAVGYLLKDSDSKDLVEAIRLAAQGAAIYRTASAGEALARAIAFARTEPVADPALNTVPSSHSTLEPSGVSGVFPLPYQLEPLTARETEVLQLMAYGKRNAVIAQELHVSEGTVKTHVHAILQKLGAEDRTQAVVAAIRGGLVR
ncbi:response regulator transcription factor [Cohnella fermenti]|uniref:Response regulator transcription factor n=1 Tax=Cohnella fermenti TaxID=2565925 RepID=A0A4S4BHW1_9BACL|nr:response regulator transcription factor [Cohnella fermenti]THF73548.1 response regulator transcription factor [Cohnella fermenti]